TEGYRVDFDVYIGAQRKERLHVDLVVGVVTTDDIVLAEPAHALDLPKLHSNNYHLYPVVDQIADKVCATLAQYRGKPSSREKDLVDLVVLAATQDIQADKLGRALQAESQVRGISLPMTFRVPARWGPTYAEAAKRVPACEPYRDVALAMALM